MAFKTLLTAIDQFAAYCLGIKCHHDNVDHCHGDLGKGSHTASVVHPEIIYLPPLPLASLQDYGQVFVRPVEVCHMPKIQLLKYIELLYEQVFSTIS